MSEKNQEEINYPAVIAKVFQSPQMRALTKMSVFEATAAKKAKDWDELKLTRDEIEILPKLAENDWIQKTHENKIFLTKKGASLASFGIKRLVELEVPLPWDPKPKKEEYSCSCNEPAEEESTPKVEADPTQFKFALVDKHENTYPYYKWLLAITKDCEGAVLDGFGNWKDEDFKLISRLEDQFGFLEIAENFYNIEPDDDATATKIKEGLAKAGLRYDTALENAIKS